MNAFVVAGTHSGAGKTSITLGLIRALARRGTRVQSFKVGPDYLDPTYLALASGRACYNLDGWMCGLDYARACFARKTKDADAAVIEGVMGLYDGAEPTALAGSTAEIARALALPVVLVVDAGGMAGSVAALVKGYVEFADLRFAGVVANRCGSARHAALLGEALAHAGLPPLLGHVGKGALPPLPERHLGLVTADRETLTEPLLDTLADGVLAGVDPEALLAACGTTSPAAPAPTARPQAKRARIGLARDKAFHFYYPDNLEALEEAGAEIVPFSPLSDTALPPDLQALILGGGYPEVRARELAANEPMRAAVRRFAENGGIVYGECGGLMYLAEALECEGESFPMVGLLPARTRMLPKLQRLGLVEVTLAAETLWGAEGDVLRGHEFHFSRLLEQKRLDRDCARVYRVAYRRSESAAAEGFRRGGVLASYIHLHLASRPRAVAHFLDLCERNA